MKARFHHVRRLFDTRAAMMAPIKKHTAAALHSLSGLKYVVALAIISCLCFAINVNGQPKTITIKVGNPESISLEVPGDSKISVPLEIVADDDKWHFVQFYNMPATGSVENRGTGLYPGVYSFEQLKWFHFKNRLSLSLVVLNPKNSPLPFTYRFSSPESLDSGAKAEQAAEFTRTDDAAIKKAASPPFLIELHLGPRQNLKIPSSEMKFEVGEDKGIEPESAPLTLTGDPHRWTFVQLNDQSTKIRLKVGPGTKEDNITASPDAILQHGGSIGFKGTVTLLVSLDNPTPAAAPIKYSLDEWQASDPVDRKSAAVEVAQTGPAGGAKKTPIPLEVKVEKERGFFQKFIGFLLDNWLITLPSAIFSAVVLFFLAPVAYDGLRELFYRVKLSSNKKPKEAEPVKAEKPVQKPSELDGLYENPQPNNNQKDGIPQPQADRRLKHDKRDVQEPALSASGSPERAFAQPLPASDNPRNQPPGFSTGTFATKQDVEEVKRKFDLLKSEISTVALSEKAQTQVKTMIEYFYRQAKPSDRKEILDETNRNLQAAVELYSQEINKYKSETEGKLIKSHEENQQLLDSRAKSILAQVEASNKQYKEMFLKVEERLVNISKQKERDDLFYGALLGISIGENVQNLQENNFEALVKEAGDSLNKFFQEKVARADILDELALKANAINTALKAVANKADQLKSEANQELSQIVENANKLACDVNNVQAQLRKRQVLLEAKIHIPVAAHPTARYLFLEELGLTVKREIDKLRDPESYFQRDVEKLAKVDVTAVADIYDKALPPGANKELENALENLFRSAGLRSILPNAKGEFKPAEQNMIQMTSGNSTDSQKVARVLSRGFYYKDNGKETLLRKAGVEVYR